MEENRGTGEPIAKVTRVVIAHIGVQFGTVRYTSRTITPLFQCISWEQATKRKAKALIHSTQFGVGKQGSPTVWIPSDDRWLSSSNFVEQEIHYFPTWIIYGKSLSSTWSPIGKCAEIMVLWCRRYISRYQNPHRYQQLPLLSLKPGSSVLLHP